MQDLLIPRRFCTCSCHQGIVDHLMPCCKPDGSEPDGIEHSAQYYDFDRNQPVTAPVNVDDLRYYANEQRDVRQQPCWSCGTPTIGKDVLGMYVCHACYR